MTIYNNDAASDIITVCISTWDPGESCDWYDILPPLSQSWDRPFDNRGYILATSVNYRGGPRTSTFLITGGVDIYLKMAVQDPPKVSAQYADGTWVMELS